MVLIQKVFIYLFRKMLNKIKNKKKSVATYKFI